MGKSSVANIRVQQKVPFKQKNTNKFHKKTSSNKHEIKNIEIEKKSASSIAKHARDFGRKVLPFIFLHFFLFLIFKDDRSRKSEDSKPSYNSFFQKHELRKKRIPKKIKENSYDKLKRDLYEPKKVPKVIDQSEDILGEF